MYSLKDYLRNGCLYLNNTARPRHKVLSSLMIYATSRCQSRCRHCAIWKKPEEHLSPDDIMRLLESRCVTPATVVGLEGGEFVLHPQADDIMARLAEHHPNYTLLSNCLAPERVIEAVRRHRPRHLYVSLDGDRDTYRRMRGRDGYDKVVRVVEALRDEVPISLMFCLSPWNSFTDMAHVVDVARHYGVDVRIGIYGTMAFFDTDGQMVDADGEHFISQIPANVRQTEENFDFVALYDEWKNKRLQLPCRSIMSELVVHSNGDVPLCQNLDVVLGNIHEASLDDIFNSAAAVCTQRHYARHCNGCWINYHRKYDIILLRNLEKVLPKRAVELLCGPYRWTADPRETYRQYMKRTLRT